MKSSAKPPSLRSGSGFDPEPNSGFTLIEMLVVIAIIVLLAALMTPMVNNALFRSRMAACMNNLRQIGHATNMYQIENNGHYPFHDAGGSGMFPEFTRISYDDLLGQYDGRNLSDAEMRQWSITTGVRTIYSCPVMQLPPDRRTYRMNYGGGNRNPSARGVAGHQTAFNPSSGLWSARSYQIARPAQTIAIGDGYEYGSFFNVGYPSGTEQRQANFLPEDSLKKHRNRGNFLMGDGSVRSFSREELIVDAVIGSMWDIWP